MNTGDNKFIEAAMKASKAREATAAIQIAGLSDALKAAMREVGHDVEDERSGWPTKWTEQDFWNFLERLKADRESVIYNMWMGEDDPEDDDAEGSSIPVQRTGTTRADYNPEAVKAITGYKREQHGVIGLRSDEGGEYYDLYENTRLPKADDIRVVYDGGFCTDEHIHDDDGPLPGNNWRVAVYSMADHGKGWKDRMWTSDQIVPTQANLVAKVDKYLEQTGDFHSFLEFIRINHTERTLAVALGS